MGENVLLQNIRIHIDTIEISGKNIYLAHRIKLGKNSQNAEIPKRKGLNWATCGKVSFILKNVYLKTKAYNTCVLPVITYGLDTMALSVLYSAHKGQQFFLIIRKYKQ